MTTQTSIPFVDLAAQYQAIKTDIQAALNDVLERGDYILGKDVEVFEQAFASYCEAEQCVGLDNGMSALELALKALGVGPGDEVIAPANTFIATVLSISASGARPVLVDVNPDTASIDPQKIEGALTPRTRAIIPVHLYGQPADMDPILEIAATRHLFVVEDACQAHGARYKGRRVGAIGRAGAFSFYPGKNLGAYGDGGALVTNDHRLANKVRMLRNYGQREKYNHVTAGYNRRLDTMQAAVLRVKLPHLDAWNAARCAHAARYNQLLGESGLHLPQPASYAAHVWHLYVVRAHDQVERDALRHHLSARGVSVGLHYPTPIHLQPAYQDLGYQHGDFPISEHLAQIGLSLPMFAELTDTMLRHIASEAISALPLATASPA